MIKEFNYLALPSGSIRLAVTSVCNMNCFYCHNEGQPKDVHSMLSFTDFKKIISISEEFGLRGISFTGGEPFLNPDIIEMIKYCEKKGLAKIDVCTNGILIDRYIKDLCNVKNLKITIGIDTCDKTKISKQSNIGKKFIDIESNLFDLKKHKIKFCINTVYSGKNYKEVSEIIAYCIKNKFDLRVIEMDVYEASTKEKITSEFKNFIDQTVDKFKLELGYAEPGKGYFGVYQNGTRIYFYNAKCHTRDCINCGRCQFRIDSKGYAIPCYIKELRLPLLLDDITESKDNFLKAIYNLGIPPEKESVL